MISKGKKRMKSFTFEILTTLLVLAFLAGCGEERTGPVGSGPDDGGADLDPGTPDTGPVYQQPQCNAEDWVPVEDYATISYFGFAFSDIEFLFESAEGEYLRWPKKCSNWHVVPSAYTIRLMAGGVQQAVRENVVLAANQYALLVPYDDAIKGPGFAVTPIDTHVSEGRWRVVFINVAQDLRPGAIDIYKWPKGVAEQDLRSTMPDRVLQGIPFEGTDTIEIEPDIGMDTKATTAFYAAIPQGATLDPQTVIIRMGMMCRGDPEDVPEIVEIHIVDCGDDTSTDGAGGVCTNSGSGGSASTYERLLVRPEFGDSWCG
jgi:predicted small lipoprotein YifL